MAFTPKQIALFYFKSVEKNGTEEQFMCVCKTSRKVKRNSGYTNLLSHIKDQHPNFKEEMLVANKKSSSFFHSVDKKSANIYGWMEWIVEDMLPLSFVDRPLTRKYSTLEPICRNSFTSYLEKLTKEVEIQITVDLPNSFGLYFDGWTNKSIHYLAVFACYPTVNGGEQGFPLLGISPFVDEETLSAQAHVDYVEILLSYYDKQLCDVLFLVGDNCPTNKSFADLVGVSLIGCASHRLNLATQTFLLPLESMLTKIEYLMKKLRSIKNSAALRRFTHLSPILRNVTRWSSTYAMIQRYLEMKEHIVSIDNAELMDMLPTPSEERSIKHIFEMLSDFESVTIELQKSSTDLIDARVLFDTLISKYVETSEYLSSDAAIVHSPDFETGIVKILSSQEDAMTLEEKQKCICFKKPRVDEPKEAGNVVLSFAQTALLGKRKHNDITVTSEYEDVSYINPTSNIVERLFSIGSMILTDIRSRLLPRHFESLLFLKVNRSFWNPLLVSKAAKTVEEEVI